MNDIIKDTASECLPDDPMDMTYEQLQKLSPGGGAEQFQMEIEVLCKNVHEREDKHGQPYQEIVIDYVTLGSGKQKTKKTRPGFPDGKLIWEEISKEPGIQYVVTLTRCKKPEKPFYDWTKIVRKELALAKPSLIEAVSEDVGAANDPSFDTGADVADTAASG
jgi:hypothetical protein